MAAAAAAGNGPLAPHMLSYVPRQCVGSIGYDVTVKQIWVSPAMSRYKSHESRLTIGVFGGFILAHPQRIAYSLDRGIVSDRSDALSRNI
jgi:hypothetical protein